MIAETVCSAVSAAGLGIAAITAYRKRFLSATRIFAYSLVPVGLVLTGVVGWVADIAFKPSVWLGFGMLAVAWLLFITTRAVERRSGGTRKERKAAARAAEPDAVAPAASAPSLPGRTGAQPQTAARPAPQAKAAEPRTVPPRTAAPTEDFTDIEEILKKHGI
ncbi:hypothetical protein OG760_04985 [Streptomyces sp. NBC_00963]|uniref:hypothetical protein n=1 Tax=Streptomyces sp. NBC_00963 TaxID=2903697 RepID=UPI0038685171|nr:hypothetical protein OG760_04985 [Streptomyces sp. NBC_00963]